MYKNVEMEQMLGVLSKHLDRKDIIGYAAARNTRILANELTEYIDKKNELIRKYGEADTDDGGNPTGSVSIRVNTPEFEKFAIEIEQFAKISHSPEIMTIPYESAIGKLSGSEFLELDWMFVDGGVTEDAS